MDFLAEPVADDPEAAIVFGLAGGFVPAVVVEAVFSAGFVMNDMRMFARDRAVDFGVFRKCEVVPPRGAVQARDFNGPADVGSGLLQDEFRLTGLPSYD